MMKDKERDGGVLWFLIGIFVATGILAGGYFVYASVVISIPLWIVFIWEVMKNKKIKMAMDGNTLAFFVILICYLISALWAVDAGMALIGFVKFLPVLLYFIILGQIGEQKEKMIEFLPLYGSLMTIFSFIMMQFPVFKDYVSVAGRLAGFFQYPNTYALFMLVCLMITIYKIDIKQVDWLDIAYVVIEIFGIFMSGSRTVFVLTAGAVLFLAIHRKEVRKFVIPIFFAGILVAIVFAVVGIGDNGFSRFITEATKSSTLLGRLLYVKDALPLIVKHPFGLGYYGYYYVQQEIQTGVYSVVNVHNEFLQFILDIGIIPAVFFYIAVVKSIISKSNRTRNKMILTLILLHSLMDYDFQFISMLFVLQLFLERKNEKEFKPTIFSKSILTIACVTAVVLSAGMGLSDFFYTRGDYETALKYYHGNTLAETALMSETDDITKMEEYADSILKRNKRVAVAYSAKGRAEFAKGNIEGFMKNKLRAIELAPYQYDEYLDYLDVLSLSVVEYLKAGDNKSAKAALNRAQEVSKMLEKLKNKTSRLGWEIRDIPQVTLPHEYVKLLEEMEAQVNE